MRNRTKENRRRRERRRTDPEYRTRINKQSARYREGHLDECRAKDAAYYEANKCAKKLSLSLGITIAAARKLEFTEGGHGGA
jgi:hypothetical protein